MATLSEQTGIYASGQRRKKQVTYGKTTRNATFSAHRVGSFFEETQPSDRSEPKPSLSKLSRVKATDRPAAPIKRATQPPTPARDEFDFPSSDDDRTSSRRTDKSNITPLKTQTANTISRGSRQIKRVAGPHVVTLKGPQAQIPDAEGASPRKRRKTVSPQPPSSDPVGSRPEDLHLAPAPRLPAQRRTTAKPPTPSKGTSAPARLTEMLPTMPDTLDLLEGFSSDRSSSPAAAPAPRRTLKRSIPTTPKQSHLWDQLLPSDVAKPPSTSTKTVTKLRQTRHSQRAPEMVEAVILDIPHAFKGRRPRLVDRLKQDTRLSSPVEDDDTDIVIKEADELAGETQRPRVSFSQVQPTGTHSTQNTDLQSQQTATSQPLSGLKLTYSRTRSYLQEDDLEENLLFAIPSTTPIRPMAHARRGGDAHKAKPKSLFDLDDESDDGSSKGIRSIHELRAAGSKKRFNDDNQALLDDIKDHKQSTRSRRRGALMELASKSHDKTFVGRFVELGLDQEFAAEFSSSGFDPVADATLCAALLRMLDSDAIERSMVRLNEGGALKFAATLLGRDKDIIRLAKDRSHNMSKAAQSTLAELVESLRTSPLWDECPPECLTTQLLALKCMDLMILKLRRQKLHTAMLELETITALVNIVAVAPDSATALSGANMRTVTTRLGLAVLEGASALSIPGSLVNIWSPQLLLQLANTLSSISAMPCQSRTLYLRLLLNLTNNQAANCALFSDERIMQALVGQIVGGFSHLDEASDEQEALLGLDDLLLSLGLAINLAEFSDGVCETVAALPANELVALVKRFLQGQEKVQEADSVEQSHGNVAHGYLAVLLGNLCQSQSARDKVRSILPGQKLEVLIAAVEEFVQLHKKVDSQSFEGEEGQDLWTHFTDRLMVVVARLRSGEQ